MAGSRRRRKVVCANYQRVAAVVEAPTARRRRATVTPATQTSVSVVGEERGV